MITDTGAIGAIIVLAAIGLIFVGYVAKYFNLFSSNDEQEQEQQQYQSRKNTQYEYSTVQQDQHGNYFYNSNNGQFDSQANNRQAGLDKAQSSFVMQLQVITNEFVKKMSISMLVFGAACWVIFFLSFSAKYSILWSFISLLVGFGTMFCIVFCILRVGFTTGGKFLLAAAESRGKVYLLGWGTSMAFSAGVVCFITLVFSCLVSISKYMAITEEIPDTKLLTSFYFVMMGFVWGVLCGALFYRQVGAEIGRGLISGSDMIGSHRTQYVFQVQNPSDEMIVLGKIFGHQLSETLANILDFTVVITLLILVYSLVSVQSAELIADGKNVFLFYPQYQLLWISIIQVIIGGIIVHTKKETQDQGANITHATFNAQNHFLQAICSNIASAILLIFIPFFFFPDTEFSIGSEDYAFFYDTKITIYDLIWCSLTGLVSQMGISFLSELFTSNGFSITQSIAQEQRRGTGIGFNLLTTRQQLGNALILLVLGLSIMICNTFGGFLGIIFGLIGLLSTPIFVMGITFFAGLSFTAQEFTRMTQFSGIVQNYTRNIAKGALNYNCYIEIINASSIFYTNIILIALTALYSKIERVSIWEPYTLLGFFIGSAMTYVLKASSSESIIAIAKEVRNEDDVQYDQDINTPKSVNLFQFMEKKIQGLPFLRTIIAVFGSFILILALAYLFGAQAVFGYIIGLNIIGIHCIVYSILIFNSSKNARNLNQEQLSLTEQAQRNYQELNNSIQCNIATANTEGKGLLLYLLLNTLFVTMGALQYWSTWGGFGDYLENNKNDISSGLLGYFNFNK